MKVYVVLKADYCEWSTEYGYSNVICIKYRESQAKNKVEELKSEDGEQYYYEEIYVSLGDIPTIVTGHHSTLLDIDTYNISEQLNEDIIAARIYEIEELKNEVKKLKREVAQEKARATSSESVRAKTEQELRTVRNTIKAAKKIDKPKFLGFEDEEGNIYPIDTKNKNSVLVLNEKSECLYSLLISDLRRRGGELKPIHEEMPKE